jgi:hypothetical protein
VTLNRFTIIVLVALAAVWAALLVLLGVVFGSDDADAATPTCVFKAANLPTTQYIHPGPNGVNVMVLQGGGSISGCPKYVLGGVSVHVCLQFQPPGGTWADYIRPDGTLACGDDTGASGPHSKYAARASVTVQVDCLVGQWRSHATGTDLDKTVWERTSGIFTGVAGDSNVPCTFDGGD